MSACWYHETMSITWVHVLTMNPCLYHESMSLPWFHVYTMSPCLFLVSLPIIGVNVCTMSPYVEVTEMQRKKFSSNYRDFCTEIQLSEVHKYVLRKKVDLKYIFVEATFHFSCRSFPWHVLYFLLEIEKQNHISMSVKRGVGFLHFIRGVAIQRLSVC